MFRKKIIGISLATMLSLNGIAFASTEIHENTSQVNLVERIRNADAPEQQPQERESLQKRIDAIMSNEKKSAQPVESTLPKVAIIYVNNAKSTYDEELDKELFKYLNQALPKDTYELIDGSPYVEILNKLGYMDISAAERADFLDAFQDSGIDYCIYLEVQPFIVRDKVTFFTIGKDITTAVPFRMINLGTGKYIYNGKYTEKASDSSMIGNIGNKSVALKALDSVGEKISAEITVRLPKTKADTGNVL